MKVNTTTKSDTGRFTTKGQVVIRSWLRKEYSFIHEGTKAIVQATPGGILLKPVTAALVKRGRGIVNRGYASSRLRQSSPFAVLMPQER